MPMLNSTLKSWDSFNIVSTAEFSTKERMLTFNRVLTENSPNSSVRKWGSHDIRRFQWGSCAATTLSSCVLRVVGQLNGPPSISSPTSLPKRRTCTSIFEISSMIVDKAGSFWGNLVSPNDKGPISQLMGCYKKTMVFYPEETHPDHHENPH